MNTTASTKRVLVILLGFIGFITVVFLYLGYFHHKFVLKTIVNEEQKLANNIYKNTFQHISHHYGSIADSILLNEAIVDAFDRKDRDALLRATRPIYNDLVTKNPYLQIMHFHTKDTRSFLRLHKPEKFGDDLSDIRHLINKVNLSKTKQIGMEVGRYGISYRIALPVFNKKGEHIGAFEFGIDVNYIFDLFNENYGFESILLLNKDIFKIYGDAQKQDYQSFSDEYYVVNSKSGVCCSDQKHDCLNHLTPEMVSSEYSMMEYKDITNIVFTVTTLKSVLEEDIGKIIFLKNLNFYTDQIAYIRNISVALSLFLVLFSFYFLQKVFKTYTGTIRSYQNKIEIKNRTLSKLMSMDHLTKINNRMSIETILQKELSKAQRYSRPISLLMLDIDDFKHINDTYGHNVGDKVLKDFTKTISSVIRDSDYFGRWGGEEFILVATETALEDAVSLAEKIRTALASAAEVSQGEKIRCSIGVAQYRKEKSVDDLIHHADLALYEAKHSGKDKVVVY